MKTAPYRGTFDSGQRNTGILASQEFLVHSDGKGRTLALIEALYATIWAIRVKMDVEVYFSQGELVLLYKDQKVVKAIPEFFEMMNTFEACMVAEYRLGAREAQSAQQRPAQSAEEGSQAQEQGADGQEARQGRRRR